MHVGLLAANHSMCMMKLVVDAEGGTKSPMPP